MPRVRRKARQGSPPTAPVVVPPKLIWPQTHPRSMTAEENARRMNEYMERNEAAERYSQAVADESKRRHPNWPDMRRPEA